MELDYDWVSIKITSQGFDKEFYVRESMILVVFPFKVCCGRLNELK